MIAFKRKRDEFEDSDDEAPSFGKQLLPVANLPEDFNDEPSDGMQYLFTVRRDARHLPHVTRVANPFEKEEPPNPIQDNRVIPSHTILPSEEWRIILVTRFRNFRQNMNQPTIHTQSRAETEHHRIIPEKKERDLWWAYLAGKPESDWNPPKKSKQSAKPNSSKHRKGMRGFDDTKSYECSQQGPLQFDEGEVSRVDPAESLSTPTCSPEPSEISTSRTDQLVGPSSMVLGVLSQQPTVLKPREPMPCLLKHIDQKMAIHLLMYFAHWINLYLQQPDPAARPLESHARWIFVLLTKVEDNISADDMSLLRNLARSCLGLLQELIGTRRVLVKSEDLDGLNSEGDDQDIMSERACWIIVCIIIGVWAQRDLWTDAEDMLKTL